MSQVLEYNVVNIALPNNHGNTFSTLQGYKNTDNDIAKHWIATQCTFNG